MLVLLCYLLAVSCPEASSSLSVLISRCINAEKVVSIAYGYDDIIDYDQAELSEKVCKSELQTSKEPAWYENKGSMTFGSEGVDLYDANRATVMSLKKLGRTLRREQLIGDIPVNVMMDRKDKQEFSVKRFISDVASVSPSEGEEVKLRNYMEGNELTIRIIAKGFDTITVESTDPS